jgi:hypothetical protein
VVEKVSNAVGGQLQSVGAFSPPFKVSAPEWRIHIIKRRKALAYNGQD